MVGGRESGAEEAVEGARGVGNARRYWGGRGARGKVFDGSLSGLIGADCRGRDWLWVDVALMMAI